MVKNQYFSRVHSGNENADIFTACDEIYEKYWHLVITEISKFLFTLYSTKQKHRNRKLLFSFCFSFGLTFKVRSLGIIMGLNKAWTSKMAWVYILTNET